MSDRQVFFDPHGKRASRLKAALIAFAMVASVCLSIFAMSLAIVPALPRSPSPGIHPSKVIPPPKKHQSVDRKRLEQELVRLRSLPRPALSTPGSPVVAAFYAPWQESGLASLRAAADRLTHVVPAWLKLGKDGASLDFSDFDPSLNRNNPEVITTCRQHGVRIMPLLSNSEESQFDAKRAHLLLNSTEKQDALIGQLKAWIIEHGFQGLNVDLENLSDEDQALVPGFVRRVRDALKPAGLEVSVDLESSLEPSVMADCAEAADWAMLMVYDQHAGNSPGPIAGLSWTESVLERALTKVPENRLVMGVGNYAYDWSQGNVGEAMTFQEALAAANGYRDSEPPQDVIEFDPESLNSHFEYDDEHQVHHQVWMLDAASAYNQWRVGQSLGLRGIGVWSLGEEDPAIWTFANRSALAAPPASALEQVHFPYSVAEVGKGEILNVASRPTEGKRSLEVDPKEGIIVDQVYHAYPFPYVLRHSGYRPKELVLTFDDGPDPTYTPAILDELRTLGVPAAFFFIGENAEEHPGLVRRAYDEGHEIGNHSFTHPNLAIVGDGRAELEINATQRAIEGIVGHSTLLFRAPYNADSEPGSREEVAPVELADRLGYTTVGEKVDPLDWDLTVRNSDGSTRPKTAEDIAQSVIETVEHEAESGDTGNIILLHDSGGNREQTVRALGIFVPELEKRGYRFVSVASLMGKDRDGVMPAIPAKERLLIAGSNFVFWAGYTFRYLLSLAFLVAIGLGVIRVLAMVPLALAHRGAAQRSVWSPDFAPKVGVAIAAYNEERVVVATVQSVLASTYPVAEVVVVDDGSSDDTSAVLLATFAGEPRVRVVRQENGGKASALNHALRIMDSRIVVGIDADTQFDPEAVGKLVRHFEDPTVAAVAGSVEVGNLDTMVTQWQSVEYTTSQNLDRQAYAVLNAITVVPGAIGAWRRTAVQEVGGYQSDTLAEDMDLTWRLRQAGHRLETEPDAVAYTEAPDTFRAFFRQRFRWAYGTLQCLWKHRRALGKHGYFGKLALPSLWLFQVVFQALAPLVDLQVAFSAGTFLTAWMTARGNPHVENTNLPAAQESMIQALVLYGLFFALELAAGFVAYRMARRSPKPLAWLFLQRFAYRQIMYGVIYKSLIRALTGGRQGWGKLQRKGTVTVSSR